MISRGDDHLKRVKEQLATKTLSLHNMLHGVAADRLGSRLK
jgi:hypothetical protein